MTVDSIDQCQRARKNLQALAGELDSFDLLSAHYGIEPLVLAAISFKEIGDNETASVYAQGVLFGLALGREIDEGGVG